jgi:hypothetical protein
MADAKIGLTNNNLAQKDPNFRSLEEKWDMVDTLWGGTDEMRAAGARYLPKAENESDVDYTNRIKHSTLFNYYRQAVANTVHYLTSQDVEFANLSEEFEDFFNNVDLEGRDMDQFSNDVLINSINHGVTYVLVDYTAKETSSAYSEYNRPYWVNIKATQMMSFQSTRWRCGEVLSYVRFTETINDDSFDPVTVTSAESFSATQFSDQIREYYLDFGDVEDIDDAIPTVMWRIWRRVQERDPHTGVLTNNWQIWDQGTMEGAERIPLVPVYANRIGFYLGEPVFFDLAELNVRHWQSYSDQANLLHYARFPILFAKGVDNYDEQGRPIQIEIGANTVQHTNNVNADIKFVEHSGKAVDSGWADINKLEEQMRQFSADPFVSRNGNVTATESLIAATKTSARVRSIGRRYETALSQLMSLTAYYYDSENIPVPTINLDIFKYNPNQDNRD